MLRLASAVRTTFAGSITPNVNMSPYSSVCALKPNVARRFRGFCPQQRHRQHQRFQRSDADGASEPYERCDTDVLVAFAPVRPAILAA